MTKEGLSFTRGDRPKPTQFPLIAREGSRERRKKSFYDHQEVRFTSDARRNTWRSRWKANRRGGKSVLKKFPSFDIVSLDRRSTFSFPLFCSFRLFTRLSSERTIRKHRDGRSVRRKKSSYVWNGSGKKERFRSLGVKQRRIRWTLLWLIMVIIARSYSDLHCRFPRRIRRIGIWKLQISCYRLFSFWKSFLGYNRNDDEYQSGVKNRLLPSNDYIFVSIQLSIFM